MSKKTYLNLLTILLLCFTTNVLAQKATITGTITDESTQEPLIAATIAIDSIGTITDFDGSYSIEIDPGTYTIEVSLCWLYKQIKRNRNNCWGKSSDGFCFRS